jgi:hypothetical protein
MQQYHNVLTHDDETTFVRTQCVCVCVCVCVRARARARVCARACVCVHTQYKGGQGHSQESAHELFFSNQWGLPHSVSLGELASEKGSRKMSRRLQLQTVWVNREVPDRAAFTSPGIPWGHTTSLSKGHVTLTTGLRDLLALSQEEL